MNPKKQFIRIVKRILAVILTICIMNVVCFAYYNPTHNSTKNTYRLEPNGIGFQATEGAAFTYTDSNGFTNRNLPMEKSDYILVMGSSQSVGFNVPIEDRFSDLLNTMLGYTDTLKVYNVAYSGGGFKDIVHNYKSLMEEFPQTRMVLIELDSAHLNLDEKDYNYAINQIDIDDSITGKELSNYTFVEKVMNFMKGSLPLGLLFVKQYLAWKPLMTELFGEPIFSKMENLNEQELEKVEDDYKDLEYWDACLKMISEESDAKITIIFHDPINMEVTEISDILIPEKMQKIENICNKYNVDVVNMIPTFTQNYLENYELPYGFSNTQLNQGHLNKNGHRLIAEEIYNYLMELEE